MTQSELESIPRDLEDLKEYFRRPIIISTGTLPTTRGNIFTYDLKRSNTVASFTNGLARLSGVFGVRFTTVFTIVVAATPFHQGVINMSFDYVSGNRSSDPTTSTNLPHVRLDVAESTMAQLKIPFLASFEFIELAGAESSWGRFAVNSLLGTPLPTGITAPTYKLFMHLEDLELMSAVPFNTATLTVNSGRVVGAQTSELEDEAYPFSGTLSSASRTLRMASRAIPMLRGLMDTPAWLLEKTSGAVRSFGYSRPTVRESVVKMLPGYTAGEHNVDVPSSAMVVGPFSGNTLATNGQLGGTDVDEMALSYVLSQWSQCTVGTLTTAQTYSTPIIRIAISPLTMWFRNRIGQSTSGNRIPPQSQATVTNCFQPTTLMAVASAFRTWRGSFEFRITFAKTKFHAGRLMLNFTPTIVGTLPSSGAVSITYPYDGTNLAPSGLTTTFDLKDSNVVSFVCPYTSSKPFLNFEETFGNFTVSILDPLVGPATVNQSIDYMVEVRAAPGFELAVPITNRWPPITSGTTVAYTQSGRTVSAPGVVSETYKSDVSKDTIGESINSIKQLIQIPKYSNCGATAAGAYNSTIIFPWFYCYNPGVVPAPTAFPRESFGLPGFFSTFYAFANGSTETNVFTFGGNGAIVDVRNIEVAGNKFPDATTSTYTDGAWSGNARVFAGGPYALHFKMPAYQNYKRIYSSALNGIQWAPRFGTGTTSPTFATAFGPSSAAVLSVTVPTGATPVQTVITRQAGDDARLAFYRGPPPFGFLSTDVGSSYDPDSQNGNL